MAAHAERVVRAERFRRLNGACEGLRIGHQRRRGDNAAFMGFGDGAIDACRQPKSSAFTMSRRTLQCSKGYIESMICVTRKMKSPTRRPRGNVVRATAGGHSGEQEPSDDAYQDHNRQPRWPSAAQLGAEHQPDCPQCVHLMSTRLLSIPRGGPSTKVANTLDFFVLTPPEAWLKLIVRRIGCGRALSSAVGVCHPDRLLCHNQ